MLEQAENDTGIPEYVRKPAKDLLAGLKLWSKAIKSASQIEKGKTNARS
jgi:hypothetical protein